MAFDAHSASTGTQAPAATPASTPAPTPTPSASTPPPASAAPAPQGGTPTPPPATPNLGEGGGEQLNPDGTSNNPYSPNYKFKVMDKEHEIPELFRGIVKDAEAEKQVREIFEKAYGLDVVKPKYQETRERLKQVEEVNQGVMASIQDLRELYQQDDFDGFFQKLKIPEEKVLQWVIAKAQYNELPPEQRQVLDRMKTAERKAYLLEKREQQLQSQIEGAQSQAKARELQVALAKPDVSTFAERFDAQGIKNAKGETITFRDAVVEVGQFAYLSSGGEVDLTVDQAVQEVMARFGFMSQTGQPPVPVIPVNGGNPKPAPAAPAKAPTIPRMDGKSSSSVAKPKVKSLDDLKKRYAEMSGQ